MATTDTIYPYEILVRFDNEGALAGAHYVRRRVVVMDGETLKDELLPPLPLIVAAEAELNSGTPDSALPIAGALGAATLQAVAAAEGAQAEAQILAEQLEAATQEIARLSALLPDNPAQ